MHRKLKAEIIRRGLTVQGVADTTGIRYQTLTAKIAGASPITIREAKAIRNAVNPALTIDELFDDEAES